MPPGLRVAVTAFIRFDDLQSGFDTGHLTGMLHLSTPQEDTDIEVNGRRIPIEYSQSAALASSLEGSRAYAFEIRGLLSGEVDLFGESGWEKDNILLMEPYRPGRIPVVLIHGTASSPARWAEMLNELQNDRALWSRYQFWLFTYNTGNPILYSGGILTSSLRRVVDELDPGGTDEALKRMVVIGHSQGGMLARMTAIDSGSRFWDGAFPVPFDRMGLSPEAGEILHRSMFYTPLPFVERVIFIATPHRGSFVAGGRIGQLTSRLITLPFRLIDPITEVFERSTESAAARSIEDIPKSTDNMDPGHQFVQTFSSIPISDGIEAHSIIAVKNLEAPRERWNDGVVAYSSAHLDGAATEIVVESGHSVQDTPQAIEEVRRILMEHLKTRQPGSP
jgi:pimeloyl-ACP methyl ester carboxylesterase